MTYQSETISAEVQISSQASLVMAQSTPPSSQKRGQVWSFSTKKKQLLMQIRTMNGIPRSFKMKNQEKDTNHLLDCNMCHRNLCHHLFIHFSGGGGNSNISYFHPEPWGKWSNLTQRSLNWLNHQVERDEDGTKTHTFDPEREREREMMVGLISTLRCYNFSVTWLQTRHHLP